jgi:hypothetical protein
VPNALGYLVGEKFLNFLEASEDYAELRAEIPAFAAEIKTIFEPYQLAEYLETTRQSAPFDPTLYYDDEDQEVAEVERQSEMRRSAVDLLLVERYWKTCPRFTFSRFHVFTFSRFHVFTFSRFHVFTFHVFIF